MSAGTKGSAAAATGFSFDAGRPFPPLAFLPGAGAGWRPVGRPGRCDARKSLKNKASGSPDDRVLKIFHKIWKSGQVDCDWFSNELLPPPNLPDRHASSGGCFRDGRGFGAAEARGTARWRKPPGADHFPDFGPHDGGNGREGLAITAERGRGASVAARRVEHRLSAGRSHGSGAPRPGGRERRRTRHFSRLLVRVVFKRRRGRGTPAR